MDDFDEDLCEIAIQESIQDAYKLPGSIQTNRKLTNSDHFMKIMAAIHTGDVYALMELSTCASAFRESDSRGRLPVHPAAVHPNPDILHIVLKVGSTDPTLEMPTEEGETPLTLAAEAGLVENVRMLLQYGASPHGTNSMNETPLLIAVRQKSYDMVSTIIIVGAFVEQVCLTKWTATHEAAKVGCPAILNLLLRHGAKVTTTDANGVAPLGIAAKYGNHEAMEIIIEEGGDVSAQATNGDTVLYDAAGSGNLDCVMLLLAQGANSNVASNAFQLPIHRAAYEGHILVLKTLIFTTTKRAIVSSGQSPVHSAADGGQVECLRLLIQTGYDVNALLGPHISENYVDLRQTALFFAVSNGDITCAEVLLAAGANTELDPLRCIVVAIRAERYDLAQLLLSYGAEVNCYFSVISKTVFPTCLQYVLRDHDMLRLMLNHGYQVNKCFHCCHGNGDEMDSSWVEVHNKAYQIYCEPDAVPFCEFISVLWLTHLAGSVVRILLDYVIHVNICPVLKRALETTPEWDEISEILSNPRPLQHLCRQLIRSRTSLRTLNDPKAKTPFPPRLKNYLTYME
ncbi:ankyrin repeat and SOCS box protein 15b isoform X2 [Centropristis striata]|uniref:ankyrin repeat and SOCS box protein 15b isoform X2 n=1 Tax=Centropristis striata TaxID=184440 RepID=UPI0027DEDBBE|nr:ankyrin repeat and SOCS box protein 15b isoform X2 [Centropristis striata]